MQKSVSGASTIYYFCAVSFVAVGALHACMPVKQSPPLQRLRIAHRGSDLALCPEGQQLGAGIAVEWGTLGRLKPDDIPAAAVDFHISSIIEELLGKPHVLAAVTKAAAKLGTDPAAALKSAMWHFSGRCNHRSMLQVLLLPCQSFL